MNELYIYRLTMADGETYTVIAPDDIIAVRTVQRLYYFSWPFERVWYWCTARVMQEAIHGIGFVTPSGAVYIKGSSTTMLGDIENG